jgi:CheY-like chemotaxis protein
MSRRIVIVEDDDWLAEYYTRVLRRENYEVHHALHAISAITVIDEVQPDVIMLDVLLTGTTALALLHELQSHADLAHIPVVLATNIADQIQLEDVKSYGVKRIIDKATMHPADIVAAIRGAVQ